MADAPYFLPTHLTFNLAYLRVLNLKNYDKRLQSITDYQAELYLWLCKWRLMIAVEKAKMIVFKNSKQMKNFNNPVTLSNSMIEMVKSITLLGIKFEMNLS